MTAVYETESPEAFTQWARDVAPPIVNLLKGQPLEVQERVWQKGHRVVGAARNGSGTGPHGEPGNLGAATK